MFNKGMGNIYKQAQQMQKKMSQIQEELDSMEIEGESGGGAVKVIVNGKKNLSAKWEDPNGDKLLDDVISDSCENV